MIIRPALTRDVASEISPHDTRDQLRGAHDRALVHDDRADHGASTRLQPPLVSCIALFGGAPRALRAVKAFLAHALTPAPHRMVTPRWPVRCAQCARPGGHRSDVAWDPEE